MTKIIKCECKNEFQDKRYGKGRRLANQTKKSDGKVFRCTVCGKESS